MSCAGVIIVLTCFINIMPPALSPQQRERLASAVDGADHREDAFLALVENARAWVAEPDDAAAPPRPDFTALLADAAAHRGDLFHLQGKIQQQTQLAPPYETVWECFIRSDDRRPVIVYVVQRDPTAPHADGQTIQIDARFYKRVDFAARNGTVHSYPAFVGAFPRIVLTHAPAESTPIEASNRLWMIGGPLIGMLMVFGALMIYVRRQRFARRHALAASRLSRFADDDMASLDVAVESGLPDDPAEALAELRRRAAVDDSSR